MDISDEKVRPKKQKRADKTGTEAYITKRIREWLKAQGIFHWKVWQGMGSEPGVADIIAIHRGIAYAIEVKTAKGLLSDHQSKWLVAFMSNGGKAVVARRVEDVVRLFDGN